MSCSRRTPHLGALIPLLWEVHRYHKVVRKLDDSPLEPIAAGPRARPGLHGHLAGPSARDPSASRRASRPAAVDLSSRSAVSVSRSHS